MELLPSLVSILPRTSSIEHVLICSVLPPAYSPILLAQAGYSDAKQAGLAGGINSIGIIGMRALTYLRYPFRLFTVDTSHRYNHFR